MHYAQALWPEQFRNRSTAQFTGNAAVRREKNNQSSRMADQITHQGVLDGDFPLRNAMHIPTSMKVRLRIPSTKNAPKA